MGRILALDFGRRRIGLALSDELGLTAQGLPTQVRKNRKADLETLTQLVRDREVARIVVGNPLHMSGDESPLSQEASAFAESLAHRCGVEVTMWDERLTTREASRVLRESGMGLDKRKQAVDRLSAVLILQGYLDFLGTNDFGTLDEEAPA